MLDILGIVLTFTPIMAVLLLANAGQALRERNEPAGLPTALAYALLALLYATGVAVGWGLQLTSFLVAQQPSLFSELMNGFGQSLFEDLTLLAAGIWLPSMMGIVLLLKPVRQAVARILPIDPDSPVDAVALSLSMLILINLMVTLGVGLDNLAELIAAEADGDQGAVTIATLWIQQLMMALVAAIGVGWLMRRRLAGTMKRLGLVMPTQRQVGLGLGIGLALVPLVVLLEYAASLVGLQADQDVERLTEELLGALFESPWGIITLGLAAAIGEEPLFRGAAQPKFGLVATSLLFALVHSNYGITLSTAIVFVLGLVLGLLRIRHNTSTAMIAHAAYNIALGLIVYFSLPFLEP